MPFDPSLPANGSPILSAELRHQFNGLKTLMEAGDAGAVHQSDPPGLDLAQRRLLAADGVGVALDWSNGAPRLPDYSTIANPVNGNLAFDYVNQRPGVYASGEWLWIG